MTVRVKSQLIDFSVTPPGELDAEILSRLRDALDSNEHFCNLVFNNNRLTDDAIKILGLILKGQTPIERLSLSSCNLRDFDIASIVNALCVKKVLRYLDLSKNSDITSTSLPDIARLIRTVTSLETVLLGGTSLQPTNCADVITAVQQNPSIKVLDLPFTVGFKVLNSVRKVIEKRCGDTYEKTNEEKGGLKEGSLVNCKSTVSDVASVTDPWKINCLPKLVSQPIYVYGKGTHRDSLQTNRPCDSLWAMDLRHLADSAVRRTTAHLYVLDKRSRLFKAHRQEKQERICAKRGAGVKHNLPFLHLQYCAP